VTPADVDVDRRGVVADALLDQPVRRRRPGRDAVLTFGLASFLICDPPPGTSKIPLLNPLQETEQYESRWT
jgi:hypothetical protein